MGSRLETGLAGESAATRYLEARGWTILERNWRFRHKEIDIIARRNDLLAIVEVKVRKQIRGERIEEHVPRQKQRFLVTAAEAFVRQRRMDLEVRFDIILITGSAASHRLQHIPDAFRPLDLR